jgi:hypothetical protein
VNDEHERPEVVLELATGICSFLEHFLQDESASETVSGLATALSWMFTSTLEHSAPSDLEANRMKLQSVLMTLYSRLEGKDGLKH